MNSRNRARLILLGCALGMMLTTAVTAEAQTATLAWDRSPETTIVGYRVSYGTAPATYTKTIDVGNVDTFTVTGLDSSLDHYFVVQAYDTLGEMSDFSDEVKQPAALQPNSTVISSFTQSAGYPLLVNQSVTWTAQASSLVGPVEYQFLLYSPKAGWTVPQRYSTKSTFTWTPGWSDLGGNNAVQVWVRSIGSTAAYEAWVGGNPFEVVSSPVKIAADVDFPTPPNNPVHWTATIAGSSTENLEYKFVLLTHATAVWSVIRDYTSSNAVTWTPPATGDYTLQVWARRVGSTAAYDVWGSTETLIVSPTEPTVTSLTADSTFPILTGTSVTWTARIKGGQSGPMQYQFIRLGPKGWQIVQPYSTSTTYTWMPTWGDEGQYGMQVWVRSGASTAVYEAWGGMDMFDVVRAPIQISVDHLSPLPPGTTVTVTAQVPDPTANFEYEFFVYNQGTGTWANARGYSTDGTLSWTPAATGTYLFQVWARKVGSTAAYDVWRGTDYIEVAVGPAHMVSLTSDVEFPSAAGATVTWTAMANSGTAAPLEYRFLLYTEGVGWSVMRDWGASNTLAWATTSGDAGKHAVQVWVRSSGSTNYEDWKGTDYFVIWP